MKPVETPSRPENRRTIVVALGGHAVVRRWQRGTVTEQFANARESLAPVSDLIAADHRVVVTHGNGPQVGAILIRVEEAKDQAYELPLGVCVAESQGEMGYMIQQTLQNQLRARGVAREAIPVLTQGQNSTWTETGQELTTPAAVRPVRICHTDIPVTHCIRHI